MAFNYAKFYNSIRRKLNLTTMNVMGMDKVLAYGLPRRNSTQQFAYILATAWWESAQTMQPVKEAYWMSEAWRKRNLRYYPHYGRGLVQTTWEWNYRKMSPVVGTDLVRNPDALLEWQYALPALFVGMEKGMYTGKSVDDYIDDLDESDAEDFREYKNARRVVNAMDQAAAIASLALTFEKGLKAGGYSI